MLEIIKIQNSNFNDLYDFKIVSKNKTLNIYFGGNLDLYFYVTKNGFIPNKDQIIKFDITKENYVLFSAFEKLYNDIINCNVYDDLDDLDDLDYEELVCKNDMYNEWNNELKNSHIYDTLVNNGVISYRHDDQIYEEANILNIYKKGEKYCLEFILKNQKISKFIDIRFRNSGSRYVPFNIPFMRLYNNLQSYNPEYHQIHIEELMYQKRLYKMK